MANSPYLIPRIESVRALFKAVSTLLLRFSGGANDRVDLSGVIRGKRALSKLREEETFRRVKLSEHGIGVVWPGGVEVREDTLY